MYLKRSYLLYFALLLPLLALAETDLPNKETNPFQSPSSLEFDLKSTYEKLKVAPDFETASKALEKQFILQRNADFSLRALNKSLLEQIDARPAILLELPRHSALAVLQYFETAAHAKLKKNKTIQNTPALEQLFTEGRILSYLETAKTGRGPMRLTATVSAVFFAYGLAAAASGPIFEMMPTEYHRSLEDFIFNAPPPSLEPFARAAWWWFHLPTSGGQRILTYGVTRLSPAILAPYSAIIVNPTINMWRARRMVASELARLRDQGSRASDAFRQRLEPCARMLNRIRSGLGDYFTDP